MDSMGKNKLQNAKKIKMVDVSYLVNVILAQLVKH